MLELVKKDFRIGKNYLLGLFFLIPFVISMGLILMIGYFGGIVLGVFVLLTIILCLLSSLIFINIDSSCKADELLLSLPIKRSVIVYSRYLTSFLMIFLCLSLIYLTCLLFSHVLMLQDQYFEIILDYRGVILISVLVSMMLLTVLPLIIKYGGRKGSDIAFFSIAFVLLLPELIKVLMNAFNKIFSFDFSSFSNIVFNLATRLIDSHQFVLYLLLAVIFGFSIFISSRFSVRFYSKRNI